MAGGLGDYAKYGTIGISWVLSTAVYLYLGYRGGRWADARFDTAPIFMVLGIVLAAAMSLLSLTKELLALDKELRRRDEQDEGGGVDGDRERKHFPEFGPRPVSTREPGGRDTDRGTKPG